MVFTNSTPFPTVITPLSNISPFTYRDGFTYLEILEKMRQWLNDTLVPDVNAGINNAIAEFQKGIENAETRVVESEAAHTLLVNNALASVADSVSDLTVYVNGQTQSAKDYVEAEIYRINTFQETTAANAMGVVRPEEFGAKGDWVDVSQTQGNGTDDTAAFQAAIDHLLENGGGTLYLSKKYLVNGTVYINQTDYQVTKPITIKGPGGQGFRTRGVSIMRTNPGDIFVVNLAPVGERITFKSLTGNVATISTNIAHGLTIGQIVVISGVDNTFNGAYTVTSIPTATSFTFAKTNANVPGTAVTGNWAQARISTLPPDETTAGFRAEGFSVLGRRTDPAVVVQGINAFSMWRVRSSFANIYFAYLDYLVHQPSAGTFGAADTYCDQSIYENLWCQFSTRGGLKLFLPDASTVRDFFYESPMDTAIHALEVRAGQGFKIDGFLAWHPNGAYVPQAGSSIIDLQTCRAVTINNLHIERSLLFESVFNFRNVEGVEISGLASYWQTGTVFKLDTVKMFKVHNWYSYETRTPGTFDAQWGTQSADITFENVAFYDGANGYAKRAMIIDKPVGQIPVTEDGIGFATDHGYVKAAYKFANVSQTLNNTQSFIHADATTGPIVLTLPSATDNAVGKVFTIVKADSTTNLVSIAPAGADTIRDLRGLWTTGSPYNLALQGYSITLMSGNGSWYVVSQVPTQALKAVFTWNPGALATGASITSPEFTATNFALGDPLALGASLSLQGLTATAYVSQAGKVCITLINLTGASVSLGAVSWTVKDLKWP